jgi:hypothetical protein
MRIMTVLFCATVAASGWTGPLFAQQKTVKACQEEWRVNKAANQAAGITERAYVAQCRSGGASSTSPSATPPTSQTPAPQTTRVPSAPPAAVPSLAGANQFTTEGQAKARCPMATVVWANLPSRIYHFANSRNYGHTKRGAYMCEQDAQSSGMRAAKNEKHP